MPVFGGAGAYLGFNHQERFLQLLFAGWLWRLHRLSGLGRLRSNISEKRAVSDLSLFFVS